MAKMIAPDALIEEIRMIKTNDHWRKLRGPVERWVRNRWYDILMLLVKHFPAVDAVEVVRCKDCEYWAEPWIRDQISGVCNCGRKELTEPNFYCAYGERKCDA